jgi:arsenite methyltransferase
MKLNPANEIKKCAARFYESNTINNLFGETLRPGGLKLTERLAEIAGLRDDFFVLDIACGKGTTSCFLSQKYRCDVVGMDLSVKSISLARNEAQNKHLTSKVSFLTGDGEELPFKDSTFDVVICECSFSLFPNKEAAAVEIGRIVKPQGKVLISDVIYRGHIDYEIKRQIPFLSCFSAAESLNGTIQFFEAVGFQNPYVEDHTEEMKKAAYRIIIKFGSFDLFLKQISQLQGLSSESCSEPRETWREFFKEAKPGYALISLTKPC